MKKLNPKPAPGEKEPFESWAILELFGHNTLAIATLRALEGRPMDEETIPATNSSRVAGFGPARWARRTSNGGYEEPATRTNGKRKRLNPPEVRRILRLRKTHTIKETAELAGVSQSTVSRIEALAR
jgi:hypothetical protein